MAGEPMLMIQTSDEQLSLADVTARCRVQFVS